MARKERPGEKLMDDRLGDKRYKEASRRTSTKATIRKEPS
jgi:hypothetical protein